MTKLPQLLQPDTRYGYYDDCPWLIVNGERYYSLDVLIDKMYMSSNPVKDSVEVQIEDTDRKFLVLKPEISNDIHRIYGTEEIGYMRFDIQIILHDQSDNTFYCYPANLGSFGIELGEMYEVTPREITVTTYDPI